MKKTLGLLLAALIGVSGFAQKNTNGIPEVINFAINNDYESFEAYVNSNGDLKVTTESGMSLPVSLAYFSTENFEKACSLLKKKKVNLDAPNEDNMSLLHYLCYSNSLDKVTAFLKYKPQKNRATNEMKLTPAQMTQYATYKYYENQTIPENAQGNLILIQEELKKNSYPKFDFFEPTYGTVGHLPLLFINLVQSLYPSLPGEMFFTPQLVIEESNYLKKMAVVTREKLDSYLSFWCLNQEITEYDNFEEILNVINECHTSDESYYLVIQTGNSPIAPFQWAIINGFKDSEITPDTLMDLTIVDNNFSILEYRIKDISYMIAIKVQL